MKQNEDKVVEIVDKELEEVSGGFKEIDIPSNTSIEKFKDELIKIHHSINKNRKVKTN